MQTALSRIWTQVADSIFYYDNRYTKGAFSFSLSLSLYIYIYIYIPNPPHEQDAT